MRLSNRQLRKYMNGDSGGCREKREPVPTAGLILKSKAAFYEGEERDTLTAAEFLYWQGGYIRKYWWALQGGVLLILWISLKLTGSGFYVRRAMGVAASLFAAMLLPELWKNRSGGAVEVECAAFYSLRQIYAARMLLFAIVDFLLLCCFSLTVVLSGRMLVWELTVQFFLPYMVTCCICFRTLYSQAVSEPFALALCMVWCGVWNLLVLSEKVYKAVSAPVWAAMLGISLAYLGYSVYKGQKNYKEMWEVKPLWN
ncbi:MAG: hypothetical protein HFJ01_02080 [Lachnospiraceae bacterium]|jgi:hypothetical protein|nr:hypothetical protein [Lachnospiraceae bacterium]